MKCRYSINGNCTNENVACEKCNSTEYEMRACTPFQRCIILHDDNWSIENNMEVNMEAEMRKTLSDAKDFIKDFCGKISGNEMNESAKQVFFLDNQQKIKSTMEALNNIKTGYDNLGVELEDGSEDQQCYELCVGLMSKLTKTLADYRNSYSNINPDVTVEQTTAVVTEETINEAVQTNTSTQKIIKDINELNEKATVTQLQEFTHAILVGKKITYAKVTTPQELNAIINEIADANPNEKVSVYEIDFKPVPLKTKTIYTV